MSVTFQRPRLIGTSPFQPVSQNGWNGLCRPEYAFLAEDVEAFLAAPDSTVLEADCRKICRHTSPNGILYSKLMWAQNDGAFRKKELLAWLKWAFGTSRALHILRISAEMQARGHFCANPVLAARKLRANGRHLNLLVTQEVPYPTLEQFLTQPNLPIDPQDAVVLAAQALAQFHLDGFVHGDFLPRNCCLDPSSRHLFFLDNDKSSPP
ncbi:MAG: hypothetical protein IJJ26_10030, partial [Victivallales bacterium]|nr:hypothetical protein [Victivallales bacterium]